MKELVKLLNHIIKKWWEPWNRKADFCEYMFWKIRFIKESGEIVGLYTLRSIVSLESGLWQFVCENKLHKKTDNFWESVSKTSTNIWWFPHNHQYRLLESALIPEKELGKFLIDNIKL